MTVKTLRHLTVATLLLMPNAVYAANCGPKGDTSTSSEVDPATPKGGNGGSRPATAGTVGAMANAGQGSFTAGHSHEQTNARDKNGC